MHIFYRVLMIPNESTIHEQMVGRVQMVTGHVKTQLIAHDKEVYDIAFSRAGGGRDMFASVGE